jgi:hypothetical protein
MRALKEEENHAVARHFFFFQLAMAAHLSLPSASLL